MGCTSFPRQWTDTVIQSKVYRMNLDTVLCRTNSRGRVHRAPRYCAGTRVQRAPQWSQLHPRLNWQPAEISNWPPISIIDMMVLTMPVTDFTNISEICRDPKIFYKYFRNSANIFFSPQLWAKHQYCNNQSSSAWHESGKLVSEQNQSYS